MKRLRTRPARTPLTLNHDLAAFTDTPQTVSFTDKFRPPLPPLSPNQPTRAYLEQRTYNTWLWSSLEEAAFKLERQYHRSVFTMAFPNYFFKLLYRYTHLKVPAPPAGGEGRTLSPCQSKAHTLKDHLRSSGDRAGRPVVHRARPLSRFAVTGSIRLSLRLLPVTAKRGRGLAR